MPRAVCTARLAADGQTLRWGRALGSERGAPLHRARGLAHGDRLAFGSRCLDVRATPGHTDGCDFAGYLHHLGLPHPRLMAIAVPANLRCGRPADGTVLPDEPSWRR